jgi:hypothetical protein
LEIEIDVFNDVSKYWFSKIFFDLEKWLAENIKNSLTKRSSWIFDWSLFTYRSKTKTLNYCDKQVLSSIDHVDCCRWKTKIEVTVLWICTSVRVDISQQKRVRYNRPPSCVWYKMKKKKKRMKNVKFAYFSVVCNYFSLDIYLNHQFRIIRNCSRPKIQISRIMFVVKIFASIVCTMLMVSMQVSLTRLYSDWIFEFSDFIPVA